MWSTVPGFQVIKVLGFQVIKVLGFYFYPGLTGLQTAIFSVDLNYLKWQGSL